MNTNSNFKTLINILKIVYPKRNPYIFTLYMLKRFCELDIYRTFNPQAASHNFIRNLLDSTPVDLNNTIVLSEGVFDKDVEFVVIKFNRDNTVVRRKAFVVTCNSLDSRTVFLGQSLFFNVKSPCTCDIRKLKVDPPKFAEEVELSLVNTPSDWSQFVIDNILKSYFRTPKLLYEDDIIEVNIRLYGKEVFFSDNKIANIDDNIYFKCNKIVYMEKLVDGGYFCAVGETTLKQGTNVQSFVPPNPWVVGRDNVMELSICPYGLEGYFNGIKNAVIPFVHKNATSFKPIFLLEGRKGSGKHLLIKALSSYFGMHLFTISSFDVSANVYAQNETKLRNVLFTTKMAAPAILEIRNFENFGKNNEGQYDDRLINHFIQVLASLFINNKFPVILFCSSNEKSIPTELKRVFLKSFEIKAPNEGERKQILEWSLKGVETSISLDDVASNTHGFLFEDLRALVDYAIADFKKSNGDNRVTRDYFSKALDLMQGSYNESLGAPKVPKVQWSDIGGLHEVKEEIVKTIKLPLKHPQLVLKTGLKRSGILMYGPPGTGKTLIAKAVATECRLCFLSVKGPELLNMYVGQSEQNVREVFERAREASPCIIFFDELDSLAPNRGASGDSGGVMDRVVSQLLAEMDGLGDSTSTIFVIGATNRPDLIDPALLRPGRFDKLLYVGPCNDKDSKLSVLKALTKKFHFADVAILDSIVDSCPENFSGADFYGVCSSAWLSAARRLITGVENTKKGDSVTSEDVIVTLEDFQSAIENIKPSIRQEDLDYFNKLKSELS